MHVCVYPCVCLQSNCSLLGTPERAALESLTAVSGFPLSPPWLHLDISRLSLTSVLYFNHTSPSFHHLSEIPQSLISLSESLALHSNVFFTFCFYLSSSSALRSDLLSIASFSLPPLSISVHLAATRTLNSST